MIIVQRVRREMRCTYACGQHVANANAPTRACPHVLTTYSSHPGLTRVAAACVAAWCTYVGADASDTHIYMVHIYPPAFGLRHQKKEDNFRSRRNRPNASIHSRLCTLTRLAYVPPHSPTTTVAPRAARRAKCLRNQIRHNGSHTEV